MNAIETWTVADLRKDEEDDNSDLGELLEMEGIFTIQSNFQCPVVSVRSDNDSELTT